MGMVSVLLVGWLAGLGGNHPPCGAQGVDLSDRPEAPAKGVPTMKRLAILLISGLVGALATTGVAHADEQRADADTIADVVKDAVERIEAATPPKQPLVRVLPWGALWTKLLEQQRAPATPQLADRLPPTSPLRWWLEHMREHEQRHATR